MSGPKGWRISVSTAQTSLLAEVLNCHEVWSWLTKAQRAALKGATEDGKVSAHPLVLRHLHEHGLTDETDVLTAAGRLVLGWNDEDSGVWRERMKEIRAEMKVGALPEVPESDGSVADGRESGTRVGETVT